MDPHKPIYGLRSIKQTWRNDAIAALSVALVSLPLALVSRWPPARRRSRV
jgi:hypothetical protein